MVESFSSWYYDLYESAPILAGLLVPFYMAAVGVVFALIADFLVKFTGIHLGEYKKEYEELLDEQQAKSTN